MELILTIYHNTDFRSYCSALSARRTVFSIETKPDKFMLRCDLLKTSVEFRSDSSCVCLFALLLFSFDPLTHEMFLPTGLLIIMKSHSCHIENDRNSDLPDSYCTQQSHDKCTICMKVGGILTKLASVFY